MESRVPVKIPFVFTCLSNGGLKMRSEKRKPTPSGEMTEKKNILNVFMIEFCHTDHAGFQSYVPKRERTTGGSSHYPIIFYCLSFFELMKCEFLTIVAMVFYVFFFSLQCPQALTYTVIMYYTA